MSSDGTAMTKESAGRFAQVVKVITRTLSVMLSECNGPHSLANPDILGKFSNEETLPSLNALDELRLMGDKWDTDQIDRYLPLFETVARLPTRARCLRREVIRKFSNLDPRGYIRPGYRADMLRVKESPFEDICNTLKILKVF